jgi:hypothetical protein
MPTDIAEYKRLWRVNNRKKLKEHRPEAYAKLLEKEQNYRNGRYAEDPAFKEKAITYARAYREANLEKVREYDRSEHRQAQRRARYDPEKAKVKHQQSYYADLEKSREYQRQAAVKRKAKIYPGYRPPPLDRLCECCGVKVEKRLTCDHCHDSNQFRGWVCMNCNLALGHVKDDPLHLRKLLRYIVERGVL